MKRSDMETVILRTVAGLDLKYPDGYDYQTLAKAVLDAVEEAGMLPPGNVGDHELVEGEVIPVPKPKWDSEANNGT